MTFSLAARCPETNSYGVAVSTAVICVGQLCPFAAPGVGAVATQSFVNPYLGLHGLDYLREGLSAQQVLDRLTAEDDGRDVRQFTVVDSAGRSAAYSGKNCVGWFGHRTGENYAAAGNMLVGKETVDALAASFESSKGELLAERLVRALEAAQAAGGDKRGRISAAVKVYTTEDWPTVDLRVDASDDPVGDIRVLWGRWQSELQAFVGMMPSKAHPHGTYDLSGLADLLPEDA